MMRVAPLSAWPWENLGAYKYLLYGPFVAQVVYIGVCEEGRWRSSWCFHLLLLWFLRGWTYQNMGSLGNMLFLFQHNRINKQGVDFKQIDREWDWDNFLILQALLASAAYYTFPSLAQLPTSNMTGIIAILILHIGVSEPLYYLTHRSFHGKHWFDNYHSLHHESAVPQPYTAGHVTLLEHLILAAITGIPILGSFLSGNGSLALVYGYLLTFDFLMSMGHCNVEFIPYQIFEKLPFLRFLIYTPTSPIPIMMLLYYIHGVWLVVGETGIGYHSLHHMEMDTNYCLFMPLFDAVGGTLNGKSWELQKQISSRRAEDGRVIPDFVFLAHVVDLSSAMHAPFVWRSFAALPFATRLFLIPFWPIVFLVMLAMWAWAKTFIISFYNLRGRLHQTWAVPRFGFQYFLPFAAVGINKRIEEAILEADKLGVKVISLAALNKNEALNGGGTLFVNKHPDLRVRVVHGNTLTAAVILNDIPSDVSEVFLTGATSKLGRAIALYLCRRKVRVLMLTLSTERFEKIKKEAPANCQIYLVQVTKYQAARHCKTWIVGKWVTPSEQSWAPTGAHFHQFVVPPVLQFRRDCKYGDLAAMSLPDDVQGLGSCEYTMDRGVVHACHAGGVVHLLEGWTHHEVGAIDVDRIDLVWKAALKHGLRPASAGTKQDSLRG